MADLAQSDNAKLSGIILEGRIEIFPTLPLPDLNSAGGMAFAARYRTETTHDLYAIICSAALPPRIENLNQMKAIDNPAIVRCVEGGVITWADGSRVYALVYQRPSAPRMVLGGETTAVITEDSISHYFITPMIGALTALMNAGAVHNAINPGNIFWRAGTAAPPQIGECLSAPAGVGQPVMYEPIERAMATPLGRGVGLHVDDCYAFGVTLALLVLGQNPFAGMDDAAIIDAKIKRGSFGAIVGRHRLSPTHIEILRGLLADDSRQRWTAAELGMWLAGRRMTPKSSDAGRRASRHFEFCGQEYWSTASLAGAFSQNVTEAAKVIENDSLNKWLRRALNDEDRARAMQMAIAELKDSGKTAYYEDRLVTRACIILDQQAPIRYRGLSVMPSGIASLLTNAIITGNNVSVIAEIIANQFVGFWVDAQTDLRPEHMPLVQQYDHMKTLIERSSIGNGLERVVYELNAGAPCFSPMLRGQYVASLKMLLPALDRVAASGNRTREPIDRHIAAFILVRDKRSDGLFTPLSQPEGSPYRGLMLLSLYSELQYRYGPDSLPNLAGWLLPLVEPSIKLYLGRATRERMQKHLKEAATSGNLNSLSRLLDNDKLLQRDRQDFIAARLLFLNIQKEVLALEAKVGNREGVVRAAGKPLAATISSFLAIILICAAVLRAMAELLLR